MDGPRPTRLRARDPALSLLRTGLLAEIPSPDPYPVEPAQARPAWAAAPFRALAFRVGDSHFAVPLLALHSVTRLVQPPTALPGRPDWHLGVIRYRGQTVVVADLGRLLGLAMASGGSAFLLVLGDGQVALRCDALGDAVDVDQDAVRWRRSAAQASWLAGVVVETLCILLDPAVLEQRIRHG